MGFYCRIELKQNWNWGENIGIRDGLELNSYVFSGPYGIDDNNKEVYYYVKEFGFVKWVLIRDGEIKEQAIFNKRIQSTIPIIIPCWQAMSVLSPNGGENWLVADSHFITWDSVGASIGNVNIDYSTDSGINWTSVVDNVANNGSYSWTVPNTPSTTCLVRVIDATDNDPMDSSNAVFTIVAPSSPTISGTILVDSSPLAGVVMSGLTGSPTTNASGVYTGTVDYNWSGTVTPTLSG